MKFLVPNYSCLRNTWLGGDRPQIPVLSVLCPQLNLLNPPPSNKIPGYATVCGWVTTSSSGLNPKAVRSFETSRTSPRPTSPPWPSPESSATPMWAPEISPDDNTYLLLFGNRIPVDHPVPRAANLPWLTEQIVRMGLFGRGHVAMWRPTVSMFNCCEADCSQAHLHRPWNKYSLSCLLLYS